MNLLLVDHAPFFGGAESFMLDLISALDRARFTPIIATDPSSPVLETFRATDAQVWTTPLPQINNSPVFFLRLLRAGMQLADIARVVRADVIHTFTARTHLIGAVAAPLSGVPLLWRIGDDTLPAGILTLFARTPRCIVAVSRWITTCYPRVHFDGLAPDGARPPLAISRADARAELGLRDDELVVAHVGRLVRWKGQDVFIRAMAQVAQTIPHARGIVVGAWHTEDARPGVLGGGESYANELRALAEQTRAPILFAGFVRDPGVAYAAADVVAHTSTLPEAFGRTIIEAMIAERPVVASNLGAPTEIVVPETGLLTPFGDATALADALARLLADANLRAEMGRAARAHAETHFSLDTMARAMERFYELTTNKRIR
ncbi:MAG: glycosyltransferase [Chloroflexi bacterium]|nr:glycosyltransferase [Chloroflexota bacterium]